MVFVLLLLGCRKLHVGMPIMRSNSFDIATACHPPRPCAGMALQKVSYGAMDVQGYRNWYACFTNERVVPLTRKYDGTFRLDFIGDDGNELDLVMPTKHTSVGSERVQGTDRVVGRSIKDKVMTLVGLYLS